MNRKVFIALDALAKAIEKLSQSMDVWVPAASGENKRGLEFMLYGPGVAPVFNRQTSMSAKKVIFPQAEPLFRFEKTKSPDDPSKLKVQIESPSVERQTLIFGARPCDARGFLIFDRVFLDGPYGDAIFRERREKSFIATLVCREGDSACFCSMVGSSPVDREGSDLWVTPVDGGYVIEALTPKAEPLLEGLGTAPTPDQEAAASKAEEEAAQTLMGSIEVMDRVQAFKDHFGDTGFWQNAVAGCLSCGVCTFVCPTCYCFTITDEARELKGERLRSWDSCMFYHYTLEASGHNPRPTSIERYRNRVGHKFAYFPEKYDGMIACSGCGRCVRSCPASIDIRKIAHSLKE
jgi:ferredoxin